MPQVNDALESNLAIVGGVFGLVCLVLLVLLLLQMRRIGRLWRRLDAITRGQEGSLEGVLESHLDTVFRVAHQVDELALRMAALETAGDHHFQRLGLVRFNPFEDTGGNQSFALALLNAEDNGFVVSSLHSRTGTRVYAKAVSSGRSETALSTEEAEAVELARQGQATPSAGHPSAGQGNGRTAARGVGRGVAETRGPAAWQPALPERDAGSGRGHSERGGRQAGDDAAQPLWEDSSGS